MRLLVFLLIAACLTAGCDWTPVRDNTVDEKSPYYVPPPRPNHPPHIEDLTAITDIHVHPVANLYMFEVLCNIVDPEYNLVPDSLLVFADTIFVGRLTYNPSVRRFYLRCTPESLPGVNIRNLFNSVILVMAVDSAGARDDTITGFNPLEEPSPSIRYPEDAILDTFDVRLGWNNWSGGRLHTFSISIWKQNLYSVWDTSGLASTDTVLAVPYDQWENSGESPWIIYYWYLAVVDNFGNRLTAEPGRFQIVLPGPGKRLTLSRPKRP